MPNLLFVTKNPYLKADFRDQLAHHAPEYNLLNEADAALPDLIIIDEDAGRLEPLHGHNLKAPVFLLAAPEQEVQAAASYAQTVVKPFSLDALLNRLRAGINLFENSEEGYLRFNDYVVRPVKKDIINLRNGETIKLTEKEVAVIRFLYKNRGRIAGKNELLQEVWGYAPDATTHTIETHIYRLRQKVEHEDPAAQLIITLDGGYQLKF